MKKSKYKLDLLKYFITSIMIITSITKPVFSETTTRTETVTVEESAIQGDYESFTEFKERLINLAKKKAVEEVNGSEINQTTIVHNKEAVFADLTANTKGEVKKYDITNYQGPSDSNRKGTIKIKAEVFLTAYFRDPNMKITANLNKQKFISGDEVNLELKTTFDAYITIINVYEDESVVVLFPNSIMNDNFVKANKKINFPSEDMKKKGVSLVVALPPKKDNTLEYIRVFASKKNIPLVDPDFKESIYKVVESKDTKTMNDLIERIYKKIGLDQITDQTITYTITTEK